MSDQAKKVTYLIYGIIQSVLLILCALCLMVSCVTIYQSGNSPFSRESIAAQYDKIAVPVILCVAGIAAGAVLSLCIPVEEKKRKGITYPDLLARRLMTRADMTACPENILKGLKREKHLRLLLRLLVLAICVIVSVPALLYFGDLSHFDNTGAGLTEDILAAMKVVLPAAAVGLSAGMVVTFACHFSHLRTLALAKEAVKAAPLKKAAPLQEEKITRRTAIWVIRGGLLVIAILFIVLGIMNNGMEDVLQKAVRICTECIGLG